MLSSSLAWLVRATSVLLERGDPLAPAHHLGETTSGPAPEVGCLDQQTVPHTHTPRQRLERQTKAAPAPPSRVSGPQAPKAAPCSSPPVGPLSGAPFPRCCCVSLPPVGQEQPQLRSQRPCPDGTRAVTAGAASGPCSVRTTGPGFAGGTPDRLLTQPAASCVTRG